MLSLSLVSREPFATSLLRLMLDDVCNSTPVHAAIHSMDVRSYTLNPEPDTLNPKPETLKPLNPKPETLNPIP